MHHDLQKLLEDPRFPKCVRHRSALSHRYFFGNRSNNSS